MQYFPLNQDAMRLFSQAWSGSHPALLWWKTSMKAWETMVAAPQVIAHRTGRMATAGPFPSLLDQREFGTMGTEKVLAFSQAWMGSAREVMAFQQQMASTAMRQWWTMMNAFNPMTMFGSLKGFPTAWNPLKSPASAMRSMAMSSALSAGNRAMSALPRIAHSAVTPVHAKATSNAKRLRRRPS
jgi:hypothetical protein